MNKREIILKNYENPFHKTLKEDKEYKKVSVTNPICVDELEMMIKVKDNLIEDILYDGEACIIAISSTSILVKLLIGKTIEEAKEILDNYRRMLNRKEYNKGILKELIIFEDTYLQPNRIECALLSTKGIEEIIKKYRY